MTDAEQARGAGAEPDWRRRYEEEYAVVDRIWKMLGVSAYTGKSIYEHIEKAIDDARRAGLLEAAEIMAQMSKRPTTLIDVQNAIRARAEEIKA